MGDAWKGRAAAAVGLIAGGGLALLATFLPRGQADYAASFGDAALTIVSIPARDLLTIWRFNLQHPDGGIVGTSFSTLIVWGVPIALAMIGTVLLAEPGWSPTWRARVGTMVLAVIGVCFLGLSCLGFLYPLFGSQGATRTLEYGAGVAALGYLCALAGAIGLAMSNREGRGNGQQQ